jgi:hypothetical protein
VTATFSDRELGDTILSMKIEKADENANCVRIQRLLGSKMEFLRIFMLLKDILLSTDTIL